MGPLIPMVKHMAHPVFNAVHSECALISLTVCMPKKTLVYAFGSPSLHLSGWFEWLALSGWFASSSHLYTMVGLLAIAIFNMYSLASRRDERRLVMFFFEWHDERGL